MPGSESYPGRDLQVEPLCEGSQRRLLAFPGVEVRGAVEAVAPPERLHDALDDLAELVEQSLVQLVEQEGEPVRYRLLETVREFGAARLEESGATADVRAAYGGRTVTFRPPAAVVGADGIDADWLAQVRQALAPLGVSDVEIAAASLEAAFLALTAEPATDPASTVLLEGATR